jgi:membrane-bound inhibitor of C-type lysozyme
MNRCRAIFLAAALTVMASTMTAPAVRAQSFQNYHCADGTEFILAFYPYDTRAHAQIDGAAVTLYRRLAVSGTRYSGGGISLKLDGAGAITLRHARRPSTSCGLI